MADRPLLLFSSRARVSYATPFGGGDSELIKPTKTKQLPRVERIFTRLNQAFEAQNALVRETADGLAPEMVLVFETRGSIEEFFKAASKIPELKWLGEYESEFDASDDFSYEDKKKSVPGKIFFMLADNTAIKQLRSLWTTWKSKKQSFQTGYKKWRALFDLLVDIRPWDIKDRLQETGILEDWEWRVSENMETIPFEIELWFRKSSGQRRINRERLEKLIAEQKGKIISETIISEISYHGILIEAPIGVFSEVLTSAAVKLFKSSDVMFFRPVGQSIYRNTEHPAGEEEPQVKPSQEELLPPIIALLDGMPVQNHVYLQNRVDVLDPDQFEQNYPVNFRFHATQMASIIIHGDLNTNSPAIKTKLLIRPVMKYYKSGQEGDECIPENFLLVDLIHRAVKEIFEGSSSSKEISSIKVINISLGDRCRVFDNNLSSWARLIDWLSFKYNVLFIVSAGNYDADLEFIPDSGTFSDYLKDHDKLKGDSLNNFFIKNRYRKILSPAESINSITVGACHSDNDANPPIGNVIQLYQEAGLPSPISRMGLGFRKSIKPDILAQGGRILFREKAGNLISIIKQYVLPPGIKVAIPGDGGNRTAFTKGTSNATAMTSNAAAKIYESLSETDELRDQLTDQYFPVVSKALLVHAASWDKDIINLILKSIKDVPQRKEKELLSRFLGYGVIDTARVLECTDKRVTLIACDTLRPEAAYTYELPLPDILSGTTKWRKLSVTLAWITPVNTSNQKYRTHKLWFDFPEKDLENKMKATRKFYDDDMVRRGTVQHEIFYSDKAQAFPENSNLRIKVNCKIDAEKYNEVSKAKEDNHTGVRYALIVTLEIDPEIKIDIYEAIQTRIRAQAIKQSI